MYGDDTSDYDNRAQGPREGKSAISAETRKKLYGGEESGTLEDLLRKLMERWQPKERPSETLAAESRLADPAKFEQQQREADLARNPWAKGGLFEGRTAAETMDPAAILASQGNTAANQWAQLGANKNITAEQMRAANQGYAQNRVPRGAAGSKGLPMSPEELAEFEKQASLNSRKTYV